MLEIVVNGDDGVEASRPDAAEQGVVLAVIAHQVDRPQRGILARQLLDHVPGVIPAAVVDDDHLRVASQALADGGKSPEELGKRQGAVVGGDHDGDSRAELTHGSIK